MSAATLTFSSGDAALVAAAGPVTAEPESPLASVLSVEEWVRSLPESQLRLVAPQDVKYLAAAQLQGMTDKGLFLSWAPESRAALQSWQVQSLNIGALGISPLTSQQISWLTAAQVQQVKWDDLHRLTSSQIGNVAPAQLRTLTDAGYFNLWTQASRESLQPLQVQALNIGALGISRLTTQQTSWLTATQVQQIKWNEFHLLSSQRVQYLTPAQLQTLKDRGCFYAWTPEARATLNSAQVQSLSIDALGINGLTTQQTSLLTAAQVQQVKWNELQRLAPSQIGKVTTAQLQGLTDAGFFNLWTELARAALQPSQVQSLNIGALGISRLTAQQTSWLTATQVQQIKWNEFHLLSSQRVQYLTPAQLQTLKSQGLFFAWTPEARGALNSTQVQALSVDALGIRGLTTQQTSWLTSAQVQQIKWNEFHFLSSQRVQFLTAAQLRTLKDQGCFYTWTPEARASLQPLQVQALSIDALGSSGLTTQQLAWLTPMQVTQISRPEELRRLPASQIPKLSTSQLQQVNGGEFWLWSDEARAALTPSQVTALRIDLTGLQKLTPQQVSWLTVDQIQSISYLDISRLHAFQIPSVSIVQMQSIPRGAFLFDLPEALQMAFTREQLLALPLQVLAEYTAEAYPAAYQPAIHDSIGADGLPNGVHAVDEASKAFALVPLNAATHTTVGSGNWNDSRIWKDGKIPAAGSKVVVAAGTTVTFDAYQNVAMKTLRIDGTLTFAANVNTQLKADTVVVYSTGKLFVGTAAQPIRDNVTARILIADAGPIDRVWDPYMLSRGIISRGEVRMYGRTTTSYVAATTDLMMGTTRIDLSIAPTGWRVGDKIVVTGDNQMALNAGAEERTILAINGSTIVVDALRLNHVAPQEVGGFIHVANLSRNVELVAEDDSVVAERPHMMFMHNANVSLANVGVYGFGRTDKSQPINDPVVINGALLPGTGTNPRARYAVHFHHTGVNPAKAPAQVSGSVVVGSAGWGYVNHSSNVNFDGNVAYQVHGASFTSEDGNEIGAMRGNLSISALGTYGDVTGREMNHDFGFEGHGFWLQGPGVSLSNNISAGSRGAAYMLFMSSTKNLFDAVNLANPALAGGREAVPVGSVPLKEFSDNVAYATKTGLEVWRHMQVMNDGDGIITSFLGWNISGVGIDVHYSARLKIRNAQLFQVPQNYYESGVGIRTNFLTRGITIEDSVMLGFEVGVKAPVRRATNIVRGYIAAVVGIDVEKGEQANRTVNINATMFRDLSPNELQGRVQKKIYLHAPYDFEPRPARLINSLFAEDWVYYTPHLGTRHRLYFNEQAPAYVPFTSANAAGHVPVSYLGLTNLQLMLRLGVVLRGGMTPSNAFALAGVSGGVGVSY